MKVLCSRKSSWNRTTLSSVGEQSNLGEQRSGAAIEEHSRKPSDSLERDFLLKELELMEAETKRLRAEGPARLQFLFTITSAVLGSLLVLAGLEGLTEQQILAAAIVASFMLLMFSLLTYEYLIGRDISSDRTVRATSRVRRYFLERAPELKQYISWQTEDGPTQWVEQDRSRIRGMVLLITAGLVGLLGGLVFFELSRLDSGAYLSGTGLGAVTAIAMKIWSKLRLSSARNTALSEQRFR